MNRAEPGTSVLETAQPTTTAQERLKHARNRVVAYGSSVVRRDQGRPCADVADDPNTAPNPPPMSALIMRWIAKGMRGSDDVAM